jgi:hypothetical protein
VGNAGNKTVIWSATGGTVTDTGLFTAPEVAGFYSVVATSQADPSATSTAVVTVVTPVVLTPGRVSLTVNATQLFTALIPATNSTSVTWSIQEAATGGTIDATGLYTAPAVAGIYHVVGTSAADPTQIGVAIVTVTP